MYKYVIFDLDGTLLNTLGDLHAAVNHALREMGFPERTMDEVRRFIGNGVVRLMERATPDGTDDLTNAKCLYIFREYYLQHMNDTTAPYEGITGMLERLKEKGIKTAVVSNKLHSAVVGLCEETFPGLIDVALGVNVEEERKPAPVNVFRAMSELNAECRVQNAEFCGYRSAAKHTKLYTIYIGDSEVDVQTAKNAGLECIGVTWGFRDREFLMFHGARVFIDKPMELVEILA